MAVSEFPRLILASASPRRKQLLGELGLSFDVVVAEVTEHEDPSTDPREMVTHNAALKADWVAVRKASEDKAGGSLTVKDGVKSEFLKPTDYSQTK